MNITLDVGGVAVEFTHNSVTPRLYKAEFNRDFFGDMLEMEQYVNKNRTGFKNASQVNFDIFTDLSWACARTTDFMEDKKTPHIMEWLKEHPDFNVVDHGFEVFLMVAKAMETKKK